MQRFEYLGEEFINGEKVWSYEFKFNFLFNGRNIKFISITEHYKLKPGRENLNNEMLLDFICEKLCLLEIKPYQIFDNRNIYFLEFAPYKEKNYNLIFWFKDNTNNHLWINFHQVS